MGIDICGNISRINDQIAQICSRLGRNLSEVRLMAVSKMQPPEAVEEAIKCGLRLFGENRVLEGIDKFSAFDNSGSEVHLIGSLQGNKAKKAVSFFDCIQSVDRESLIEELGKLTAARQNPLMVFLEFHTGEESKKGFPDTDSLFRAAEKVHSYPGLKPMGLMTMAPFTSDKKAIRASFGLCRAASAELEKRFGKCWAGLSMGMTGDYEIALEEGSTLLRIGTAIFGNRQQ